MPSANWEPVLVGDARERALRVLEDITASLSHAKYEALSLGPSLAGGQAGLAVYFAYLNRFQAHAEHVERAARFLDRSADMLSEHVTAPSLYGGFCGVAWVHEHVGADCGEGAPNEGPLEDDDPLAEIDALLDQLLAMRQPLGGEYDLISGWVGLGVYALERLPRGQARGHLARILELLESSAEHAAEGVTWRHPRDLLPEWQKPRYPEGWYNVGLAHGVPGVVALLSQMILVGVEAVRAESLLRAAVRWLLSVRLVDQPTAQFPGTLARSDEKGAPVRNAWCYGDPGVAAALFLAGRALGDESLERIAVDVMRAVAERPICRTQTVDALLCHGSAGLAHLFNRFYQATGAREFAAAAADWFERVTVEQRKPGAGVAGYLSYQPGPPTDNRPADAWRADPGILTGAAGVGLALISAVAPVEPNWDRALLVALPPRAR